MTLTSLPFLLIFVLINSCIELEISAPSFPDIMKQLQVSESAVGLTITYNLIGFCIASVIYGPLSEFYGRRRVMLIGNGILAIGAIGCVVAPSIKLLLISRFIQGLGAATSAVITTAIIADVYPTHKAAKLYGIMNAVFTTLMALAPILGGIINSIVGWRGNYGIVAVICVVSWLLLYFFLPETYKAPGKQDIKVTSRNLFLVTIHGYKQLLSSKLFLSAAAVPSLLYGCYMAFVAVAPFTYMQVFKLNMLIYTLHQGTVVVAFAVTSALSGRVTEKLGRVRTMELALLCVGLGSIGMLFSSISYTLTFIMSLFSIGFALLYPIVFASSLEIFPNLKGIASSVIMSLRYLLCSGITGITSYLYDGNPAIVGKVICWVATIIWILSFSFLFTLPTRK